MPQPFSQTEPSDLLVQTLGQTYDPKAIQQMLLPLGIKRMPQPISYFNDDIIWSAKASLRLDVYRAPKINELTAHSYSPDDGWIVGCVHFLAPGSDDRIKAPYAGTLPGGLPMDTAPGDAIAAYGLPAMDEMTEWPGFSGRILAWRTPTLNIAMEFEEGTMLRSCTFCLIGCIGSWRDDQPEIFAP
ncbi:hypothetical protein B9G55_16720 [Saccharibacillus sp. O16]|nr:hypothetical protein B9G55_16720 [Saccharibacillus sp. O16]